MSRIVLDTGALIALDRNDRSLWADLKAWGHARDLVIVPSTALAQSWRGSASQAALARALRRCTVAPFDGLERRIGELCGRAGSDDICDAHVALIAATCDAIYTSDPGDLADLIRHARGRTPVIVRC